MDTTLVRDLIRDAATELIGRRAEPGLALAADAELIADACRAMAARFQRGGKLLVFGNGDCATDAQHIVVEFVHPVIMGRRALPAMALTSDVATLTGVAVADGQERTFSRQLECFADAEDIALGLAVDGHDESVAAALARAHDRGLLTIVLAGGSGSAFARQRGVDHLLLARSDDRAIVKELHVTTYHLLWELVHVFFDQPTAIAPRQAS